MKLSKGVIDTFKNAVTLGDSFSSKLVVDLLDHIEVLEQELDSANAWMKLFRDTSKGELLNERVELKQENLQRLEEVKGLQRQVQSLTNFSNQKVKDVKRLNEDASKAWAAYNAEYEARILLEATLEQAMLDHQPVVLPKFAFEVLEAERFVENREQNYWKERVLLKLLNHQIGLEGIKFETILQALANGYTVEQTVDEANEAAFRAGMEKIYAELDSMPNNRVYKRIELGDKILQLVKEIYSNN